MNTDQSGIISGIFSTVDYGSATSEVTASDTTGMQTAATEAAASHIVYDSSAAEGEQYSIATETQDVNGVSTEVEVGNYANQTMTQEEMEAAYDREYTKSFNAQFSSAAGLMRSSDSTVTVTGLGVIADVNASENSSFKASAKLLDGAARDGNGNGMLVLVPTWPPAPTPTSRTPRPPAPSCRLSPEACLTKRARPQSRR